MIKSNNQTSELSKLIENFNKAHHKEQFCPKCGAGIFDPFGMGQRIHNVTLCRGIKKSK